MAWAKRTSRDIKDLTENGFVVLNESLGTDVTNLSTFCVEMKGPKGTSFDGYKIHVRFTIPDNFPFASPSVGFVEKVQHPNVDYESGSICLDSLNSKWSPVFTLRHILEDLLPQLLSQPNPEDPLNREAAHLLKNHPTTQHTRVRDLVVRHCKKL